jgi:solute carrier family 24 (sodium/potassium/calcium exchanger), member 6
MLFSTIGIAASEFFCPNLATLSQALRMSESMAGVTFLALGNGSPDLFSTFAAMKVGSGGLAIGELIGAAFFITSVVAGSMAIVKPFKVSRRSFLRDALFFAGAVGFSVGLLADGKVSAWETSFMIAYYVVYVTFVMVATWYWHKHSKKRRAESRARQHYQVPGEETIEAEDDEATTVREATPLIGDVRDLEASAEDDEDQMEQKYAAIQHRMSLLRPAIDAIEGTRSPLHHTHSNIRPSLFGALEVLVRENVATNDSFMHYRLS